MALRGHNSGTESAKELFKCQRTQQVLYVAMNKNILVLSFRFL